MRSDHLSKHLKTHLSNKKTGGSPQQVNGMPTIVTITQNQDKLGEEMIDESALDSVHGTIKTEPIRESTSIGLNESCSS